jgi:hypothetical protein
MKEGVDVDYYLESNQEPEFVENEFSYDGIKGLEEFDDGLVGQIVRGTAGEEGGGSPTSITPMPPVLFIPVMPWISRRERSLLLMIAPLR